MAPKHGPQADDLLNVNAISAVAASVLGAVRKIQVWMLTATAQNPPILKPTSTRAEKAATTPGTVTIKPVFNK